MYALEGEKKNNNKNKIMEREEELALEDPSLLKAGCFWLVLLLL